MTTANVVVETGGVGLQAGNVIFLNSLASASGNSLTVNAAGTITQAAPLSVTGAVELNGSQGITVANGSNDFSTLRLNTANGAAASDANALSLGTSDVTGGNLSLVATTIAITGPLDVAGTAALNASNGSIVQQVTADVSIGDDAELAASDSVLLGIPSNDFEEVDAFANSGSIDVRDTNSMGIIDANANTTTTLIADENLSLPATGEIDSAGAVDLVSDAAAGAGVGTGGISMAPGSDIASGQPVSLYTARRSQNDLQGTINGSPFVPGPEFVDSDREKWGVASPAGTAINPFTVFYKEAAPVTPVDPVPDPLADPAPPETTITGAPKKPRNRHTYFSFTSSIPGSSFRCGLDGKAFESCSSPVDYRNLKRGRHSFAVFAVSPEGVSDPTPATFDFKVKRKKKRK
jgi:hypothetical protein